MSTYTQQLFKREWPLTIFVITSIVMLVNGFTLKPLIGDEWASQSRLLIDYFHEQYELQ